MATKTIEGFPNYTIDTEGRVWSRYRNRYLRPNPLKSGYLQVQLWGRDEEGNTKKESFYIHRLVGKAFLPNPDNLPTIDHINRHKFNNRVSNLRWTSQADNCQNRPKPNCNTSGHKYITKCKYTGHWRFLKSVGTGKSQYRQVVITRETKTEILSIKFAWLILNNYKNKVIDKS